MKLYCHNENCNPQEAEIVLAGNPNTGKSCLFNFLTGINSIISNYPGTTVEIVYGKSNIEGNKVALADLPGIYSLGSSSEDEKVTTDFILEKKPKVIINVIDSNLLERNLYLTLQLLELKIPTVIALNFYEELEDKGISINHELLSKILKVPVVPIDALRGFGIKELAQKALELLGSDYSGYKIKFDLSIEKKIKEISSHVETKGLSKRAISIGILEGNKAFENYILNKKPINQKPIKKESKKLNHDIPTEISKTRHAEALSISKKIMTEKIRKKSFGDFLDRFTTEPITGIITLFVVIGSLFFSLFYIGGFLSTHLGEIFSKLIGMIPLEQLVKSELALLIIKWSLDGISAGLQIAIPYIAIFYILLAFLEDSGYLPRMAYILDKMMHRFHLHGKAVVPMMLGFGCSVPAILATRILPNKKERIITATIVCLIPCSARTAVIMGSVSKFIGIKYALAIYAIVLLLIFITGKILGRFLSGESEGLILEMPEYRLPQMKNVLIKTWLRMSDFITIAFPLIIIGSIVLGLLKYFGLLEIISKPFQPVIGGWLMLPAVAGITLIYGILRKELALELLFILGGSAILTDFMTPLQIFTFALVVTLYFPCIGTFTVLKHEFGWKKSLLISFFTILIAILVGGIAARFIEFFHLI